MNTLDDRSKSAISDALFELCRQHRVVVTLKQLVHIQGKIIARIESCEPYDLVFVEETRSLRA